MNNEYYQNIKNLIKDLHKDYKTMLYDNYTEYVNQKAKSGISMATVKENLADPSQIAERYKFYARIYSLLGQKNLDGASKIIKHSVQKEILDRKFYTRNKIIFLVKCILLGLIGVALCTVGILFFVANAANERSKFIVVLAASMVFISLGCFLIYKILDVRRAYLNKLLQNAMDGCKIEDFSKN